MEGSSTLDVTAVVSSIEGLTDSVTTIGLAILAVVAVVFAIRLARKVVGA